MLSSKKHIRRGLNPIDTGIFFEALEPRLLFSGSPEGVVVDTGASEPDQTTQSVVEAENFTFPEDDETSAFDSLSVIDPLPYAESTPSDGDPESIDTDSPSADPDPLLNIPTDTTFAEAIAPEDAIDTDNALFDDMLADTADAIAGIADDSLAGETTPGDTLLDDALLVQTETAANSTEAEIIPAQSADEATVAVVPKELVFVNDDIWDYDQLTEDLAAQNTDGRDITVVTLSSEQDGIEQISSVLAESEDIDAVHFVSHGTDRAVKLGDTWIDSSNVEDHAPDIANWGDALTDSADLLFYGCNLAGGDAGLALLEVFRDLTDADVAASTDDTGHAVYGGDWDLEYTAGSIETMVPFSDQVREDWEGLLAVPVITARETIDSDYDGQIDQIKITTDQNLDDDFSGLTMTVSGYTVTGYSSNITNDAIFYVDLTESGSADTDATPTVTVTANTTLSEDGGINNIATDAGVLAADTAAPVVLTKETADLDGDGFIDAIHVTFSEAIDDTTVLANDWDVVGVAGETFVWNTNGDTADDADIYISFADAVLDTGATPDLTYTPDGPTDADVQDLAGNALSSTESWWNASWLNRTQITFDNAAQAENLTDFPVLVSLTASEVDFDKIEGGGADIRFIDRTTGTELNYQIEDWDDGAETATVWVNVPQIDGSSDTDFIWMYYNNPGAFNNSSTAAWNADFEGVWHLNEATDANNIDATSNTNDGTPQLSPAAATGKISGALDFSVAAKARVEIPFNSIDLSTGVHADWTISAWVKPNSDFANAVDWPLIYSYGNFEASLGLNSKEAGTDGQIEHWRNDNTHLQSTGTAVTVDSWNHVAVVRDSTSNTRLYLNGVEIGSGANVAITDAGLPSWIGSEGKYEEIFKGLIDEVRVSSTARSADWLAAQCASINLSFNTYGAEQAVNTVHGTTDKAAPVVLTKETADLDSDGSIDALHLTFSEAISDASVQAGDFTVSLPNVTGLAFNAATNGDTGDDADIYLTFTDGAQHTGITPSLSYAQSGGTDLEDLAAAANQMADFAAGVTTDKAAPVLLSATSNVVDTGDLFDAAGEKLDLIFSETLSAVPSESNLEAALTFAGGAADGDNLPAIGTGIDPFSLVTTTANNDTIRVTFNTNNTVNADLLTVGTHTVQVTTGTNITDAAANTANTLPAAVTINAVNEAPLLDNTGTMTLTNVAENDTDPAGDTVADIILSATGDRITDANIGAVEGIAVIGVSDTNGTWQYDAGGGWTGFGAVTNTDAVLLNPVASIRFVPDADYSGSAGNITFRAWDQTSGSNGDTGVDVSTNGTTTAYSTVTETATLTVTSVNDTPVANDAVFTVAEDAADGTVVGTVTATDLDTGDTLTYSITAGNSDGIFAIDSATGKITIADNAKLDYETAASHSLTVQVKDAGNLTDTFTTTVNVTGVNEEPSLNTYAFSIDENSADGTRLGAVSAGDPDAGDTFIYSIIAGNDNDAFKINAATGEITINNSDALDYETNATFNLTVRVTDSGSPALTKTSTVTVNLNDVQEIVFLETEPVPEPADTAGAGDTTSGTDGSDSGKDKTGNDDSEGQTDKTGPVNDRSVKEENQASDSEDTFDDVTEAETDSSLSDVPDFLKLYALDTTSDRTDRENNGDNGSGQGGKKDLKSGTEANGNEKQAPAVNELASGQGALGSGLKGTDRMSAQARKMLSNTHIQNQLDALKEQINHDINLQKGEMKFMVGTAGGVTATAVAGYMLWMFRGVSLIASAMASLPVWQFFDPLPVLSRWEKTPPTDSKPGEDIADENEKRLDDIFKKDETRKKNRKIKGKR